MWHEGVNLLAMLDHPRDLWNRNTRGVLGHVVLLCGLCGVLFFRDLGERDLWAAHEARAAQNAQRMLDEHDWGLPHLYDGQPDLQKPPAYYWMIACVATLQGGIVDAWAVRFPVALSATGTVLLLFGWLWSLGRPHAAMFSAIVLATAVHFTGMARVGRIDMPLTFVVSLAVLLMRSNSRLLVWTAILPLTGGALLKGPIGIVLPSAVVSVLHLADRLSGRESVAFWGRAFTLAGVSIVGTMLATPWYLWANAVTDGEFVRVFFWYHNFQRALGGAESLAGHPFWYYLPRFAIDFLPWSPMVVGILFLALRNPELRNDPQFRLGVVWFVVVVGLLSCSRFKRGDYLLPAYPGTAVLVGCFLERWYVSRHNLLRRWAKIGLCVVVVATIAGHWINDRYIVNEQQAEREQLGFAQAIRQTARAPQTILLFRVESHLLAYHLGRPLHTLVEWGELNDRLRAAGTHYFVTRAEFVAECLTHVRTRRIEVLLRSDEYSRRPPKRPLVLMRTVDAEPEVASCPNTPPKD